jgi:aflatoxin B1 aldehyde reductase
MSHPKVIFGSALLGMSFNDLETVNLALDTLSKAGIQNVDTAPRYPPFQPGTSEKLLGEASATKKGFQIDSKVLAQPGGGGELEPALLKKSIMDTLARLDTTEVSSALLFYILENVR